jgi:6,7-dimethyl-8-ribityllumazine synthase
MSGAGSPPLQVDATGLRVGIIASQWHGEVMAGLVAGAVGACVDSNAQYTLIHTPGAFELPIATQAAAQSGRFDALVALGVVIRGGTPHFEYVCQAATIGIEAVARETLIPVGFGVLTCDDTAQALDRAGLPGSSSSKGAEAVVAALVMALTLRDLSAAP